MFILLRVILVLLTIFGAAVLSGLFAIRHPGREWKFATLWLFATFLVEILALYCNIHYHNNLAVYAIGQPLLTVCACLYFNYSNPLLNRKNIGIYIAVISLLLNLLMHFCGLIRWNATNTDYILLEAILEIILAFTYFYYVLQEDRYIYVRSDPNLWIAFLIALANGGIFFQWVITEMIRANTGGRAFLTQIYTFIAMLALGYYLGFCILFLYFFKKKLPHEQ